MNSQCFEDELYSILKQKKFTDPKGRMKYICRLIKSHQHRYNFKEILKERLESILQRDTGEIINMVYDHLKIKRHYGFAKNKSVVESIIKKKKHRKSKSPLRRRGKSLSSKSVNGSKYLERRSICHNGWNDIANAIKLDMPCSSFRELGYCMDSENCKYKHDNAILVKPRRELFNSIYDTSGDHSFQAYQFLLPNHNDSVRRNPRDNDVISVSSGGESVTYVPSSCLPRRFTPPSVLDGPLWYEELGLVEEVTQDEDVKNIVLPDDGDNCLLVYDIPPEINRIGVLNRYFRKFGLLRNIHVVFDGDTQCSLVEFENARDARLANESLDAVLGNRFIQTRIYRPNDDTGDNRYRRRRRVHKRHRRRSRRNRRHHQTKRCARRSNSSSSRSRSDDSDGNRSIPHRSRSIHSSRHNGVVDDQVSQSVVIKTETMTPVETINVPCTAVSENVSAKSIQEPMDTTNGSTNHDTDLKLERAINDSDVDSPGSSPDRLTRRVMVVGQRRTQLRNDLKKNGVINKMRRLENSLSYYKSLLETLIVEFRAADKAKKSILVSQIKDKHAIFMQLKKLKLMANAKSMGDRELAQLESNITSQLKVAERSRDPVDASDGTDQSLPQSRLLIWVPTNVVIYAEQVQAAIGHHLTIANIEMSACSSSDVLYIVSMRNPDEARQALEILTGSSIAAGWRLSIGDGWLP